MEISIGKVKVKNKCLINQGTQPTKWIVQVHSLSRSALCDTSTVCRSEQQIGNAQTRPTIFNQANAS